MPGKKSQLVKVLKKLKAELDKLKKWQQFRSTNQNPYPQVILPTSGGPGSKQTAGSMLIVNVNSNNWATYTYEVLIVLEGNTSALQGLTPNQNVTPPAGLMPGTANIAMPSTASDYVLICRVKGDTTGQYPQHWVSITAT